MEKWTPKHDAPEPLEGPVVATITGGTILWFVLFLVQLPFYGWFDDRDATWWVWTCLAGCGPRPDRHLVRAGPRRGDQAGRGAQGGDGRGVTRPRVGYPAPRAVARTTTGLSVSYRGRIFGPLKG